MENEKLVKKKKKRKEFSENCVLLPGNSTVQGYSQLRLQIGVMLSLS